eukprot:CAMPEP_0113583360 /NCGR_PEP_ID=MMETSP0015_2-20120614/32470_1 /TAXON_ID=2838 /ORGANISM="Odontella" /LENGTH=537 /DNA_ID=CAMNT_0000488221 /DNA_START=52 /DNA_END=1665 /DNA_ORIENTATION=+ /assembly_acc=CAM_ASM_000160
MSSRFQLHFLVAVIAALLVRSCSSFATPRKGGGFVGGGGGGGGGASSSASAKSKKSTLPPPPPIAADDEVAEQVARQLFGVCSHLQNPELYTPSWAHTSVPDDAAGGILVANTDIARGDIVTFYPVHSLGLRGSGNNSSNKKKKKTKKGRRRSDYLIYDSARDGVFGSKRRTTKCCIDFPALTDRKELRGQSLFLDANSERELVPGWMGHICEQGAKDSNNSNCAAIPLQGVAPLCMVVATRDIAQGETLVRDGTSNEGAAILRGRVTESGNIALTKYASEITELASYTNMAYPKDDNEEDDERSSRNNAEVAEETVQTFKKINLQYPGIQAFHRDPDIICVDHFLTEEECDRIIAKCKPHMANCVTKDPMTGVVGPDPRRTSTEAMLPQAEAPALVSKLVKLLDCREDELEILQVLRYEEGQEFKAHTDGFDDPTTAAGFENSGRLVTLFAYLSNVRTGGHTEFMELGFSVAPKKGSAVIHFPASEQLQEDKRTAHRSTPAGVDEKWILATWVWQHSRTDTRYAEERLQKLSEEII